VQLESNAGCAVGTGPQVSTAPHESANAPHAYPSDAHVCCGEQAHVCEFALQVWPTPQPPQSSMPPQPSLPMPHCHPSVEHVWGLQPHWFIIPAPPHVAGGEHVPQGRRLPQPSSTCPHVAPCCAQDFGVHGPRPHLRKPPPPQVWPVGQLPHERVPPQPSGICPHCAPKSEQLKGVHLQTCASQDVLAWEQVPQSTGRPQASVPAPHSQWRAGQPVGI
jgi:hypothetical protein